MLMLIYKIEKYFIPGYLKNILSISIYPVTKPDKLKIILSHFL